MPDRPTPEERLNAISEQGLCTGCGLCQSVAGPERVRVVRTGTGYERPVITGPIDHATVDRIYDTCPELRAEGLPERLAGPGTRTDNVWGPWRRMVLAWAADPAVRHEGSTGGVLTALAQYLLRTGRVAFVLHVRASETEPTFGTQHLSFTEADVLAAAGSRYGPAAPLVDIADVLARDEPFAFVGKPCDIAGLRNLARHDARVDRLVRYRLTPVCGGYMPPASMDAFLRRIDIAPEAVTGLRYRGRGCPGPTRIETAAGAREVHYLDLWGEDESMWALPWRCKICPDVIGEAADIAAADTWPGGAPDRVASETDPGTNALVVRTAAGAELVEAAARDGAIALGSEIVPDTMSHFQPHQMRKKYAAWGRHRGLADAGRLVPSTARLRLEALAAELPEGEIARQRAGTASRIAAGKATEPTPVAAAPRQRHPRD